jgi:hypothetical protein
VDSWVSRGENQGIAPDHVPDALGPEAVEELQGQTGLQRNDVLSELSRTQRRSITLRRTAGLQPGRSSAAGRSRDTTALGSPPAVGQPDKSMA